MQVVVEIPDEFAALWVPTGTDAARKLLEDGVAQAYRDGKVTTSEVRRALGFSSRFEVEPFLRKYGIVDYTTEEYHQDVVTVERLRQQA